MMSAMPSKLTHGATSAFLAVALIAPAFTVRVQDKAAERADQLLDYARHSIWRSVHNAFALSRPAVYEQTVLARVSSRVHWMKKLVGPTLELEVRDDGSASLCSAGSSKVSKDRAVFADGGHGGVTQVIDELTVPPHALIISSPLAATTLRGQTTVIKP
jgi:hypothetical protein